MDNNANQSDNMKEALHISFWASHSADGRDANAGFFNYMMNRDESLHEPSNYINLIEAAKQVDKDQSNYAVRN